MIKPGKTHFYATTHVNKRFYVCKEQPPASITILHRSRNCVQFHFISPKCIYGIQLLLGHSFSPPFLQTKILQGISKHGLFYTPIAENSLLKNLYLITIQRQIGSLYTRDLLPKSIFSLFQSKNKLKINKLFL